MNRIAKISPLTNLDIRLLKVFRTVAECGGFAAAEVELNISCSAISISMSDLEERIGLRLCQRGRAGFSLTEEGKMVYEASQQLMASIDDFRSQIDFIHARLTGQLSIGITDNLVTIEHMKITEAIKKLKKIGPEVEIQIRMIPPNEIERSLHDGGLHVGVIPHIRPLPGLEYMDLYVEESNLYCSSEHPLFTMEDDVIDHDTLQQFEAVAPAYAQNAETRSHYLHLKTTATATDREGVAFLILTDAYIGFLPAHFASRWVRDGRIRAIRTNTYSFSTDYQAVTRKGIRRSKVLETFLNLIEI